MIEKTSSQTQKAPEAMGDSNLNIFHQASKLTMNIPYTALDQNLSGSLREFGISPNHNPGNQRRADIYKRHIFIAQTGKE